MYCINRMRLQSVEFEHTLCVAELKSNALDRSVNLTLLTENIPYCLVIGNTKFGYSGSNETNLASFQNTWSYDNLGFINENKSLHQGNTNLLSFPVELSNSTVQLCSCKFTIENQDTICSSH